MSYLPAVLIFPKASGASWILLAFDWFPLVGLVGAVVILGVLTFAGFRRRDIHSG
ncbi:hypothetical protein [Paramicrobacterium fandaimingii]|uniref:hypothetical protein n=1 Tax=Paramicrobacterium fandaimingii TaxID=2708079 RepID=UPI0014239E89|nr:hypothetical protein [Microbacterium fandaimingii]